MNYYSPSRHYSGDEPEATDQREALTETIERVTRDAKHLADQFGEQVEYLEKRHGLIVEMIEAGEARRRSDQDAANAGRLASASQ
jgi:hypothetical protein